MPRVKWKAKPPRPELVNDFEDWLLEDRRLAENTARSYASDLLQFLDYCRHTGTTPTDPSRQLVRAYLRNLASKVGANTQARQLSTLRAFYDMLGTERNPAKELRHPKRDPYTPPYVSRRTVMQAIDAAADLLDDPLLNVRNQALFCIIYASAGRISDVLGATTAQLSEDDGGITWLHFGKTKNRLPYDVPVPPVALQLLHAYHEAAGTRWLQAPLFMARSSRERRALKAGQARYLFSLAQKRLESGRLHPHLFRHALAHHLLESGVDSRIVQAFLGHKNAESTAVYTRSLRHLMRDTMLRRHPLGPHEEPERTREPITATERHRGDVPERLQKPRSVAAALFYELGDILLNRPPAFTEKGAEV